MRKRVLDSMRKLLLPFLLSLLFATAHAQNFRPYVSEQASLVSQPGYRPVESITNVGAAYQVSRFTFFSVARTRFFDHDSKAVTWVSGGNYRFYKGFNAGVAEVNFHAWVPKPVKYVYWNAPTVALGWSGKRDSVEVFRTLGGGGVRVAHDNWDYQYEHRLTHHLSLLGEVQSYQYKYPNAKKSPRAMDAEVDMGVKWYLR